MEYDELIEWYKSIDRSIYFFFGISGGVAMGYIHGLEFISVVPTIMMSLVVLMILFISRNLLLKSLRRYENRLFKPLKKVKL